MEKATAGLYTDVEYDSETGYVSSWALVEDDDDFDIVTEATSLKQKGQVIATNSGANFYMTDDAVIYEIDGSDVETISAKTLCKTFVGGTIYAVLDKDGDTTALYVVV